MIGSFSYKLSPRNIRPTFQSIITDFKLKHPLFKHHSVTRFLTEFSINLKKIDKFSIFESLHLG